MLQAFHPSIFHLSIHSALTGLPDCVFREKYRGGKIDN